MSGPRDGADESRWAGMFRRGRDAVFVLNRRRRVLYVNPAWELTVALGAAEARGLTCTRRLIGQQHAALAATLAPPDEVMSGRAVQVRRPAPNQPAGPPWWDIDFLPVMGDGRLLGVVGRLCVRESAGPSARAVLPAGWAKLRAEVLASFTFAAFESALPTVRRAVAQARMVAKHGCPAVIVGPPGSGKWTLARTIHAHSVRCEQPCLSLDGARLPHAAIRATLLESRGSELPEWAGLIYLHDPAHLPLDLQVEIARRLGDQLPMILGCPSDPEADIGAGRLSAELFAAFGVVVMELPPLRKRLADLPSLWAAAGRNAGRSIALAPPAWEAMNSHAWPGNLDELMELVGRLPGPTADIADLPLAIRQPVTHEPPPLPVLPPLDQLLERIEARMIRLALHRAGGNKSKAAELLGVWRPRLLRRLEALGLAGGE